MDPFPKDAALAFASRKCFHQSIRLPPTGLSHQKPLRVSFATTSNFDDGDEYGDNGDGGGLKTILFCGGMGASRLMMFRLDALARRKGLRVVFIDRPGVGGSTAVPLDQRVQVWLQAVLVVLEQLKVKTVALVSHSVGAVYAVNVLLRLPHLVHPTNPFVAMLTPWVHPSYSSAPLMQVVDKLPSALVGSLHHITSFVGGYIAPSIQFSSGIIGVNTDDLPGEECLRVYGMNSKTWTEVTILQGQYARLEDMSGISADAKLCMQKDARDWGVYTSLPTAISALQEIYPSPTRPLKLTAYFAASDNMIGKGGQKYFEQCWENANSHGQVEFEAKSVKDTDHDSITLVEKGCLEEVLCEVARLDGMM